MRMMRIAITFPASLPATSLTPPIKTDGLRVPLHASVRLPPEADAPHTPEHIPWFAASPCSQGPGIPNTRISRFLPIPIEYPGSNPASNAVVLFLYHKHPPSPCGKIPVHHRHLSKTAVLMISENMSPFGSAPRLPVRVSSH